jgi:polyketide synthase PksN
MEEIIRYILGLVAAEQLDRGEAKELLKQVQLLKGNIPAALIEKSRNAGTEWEFLPEGSVPDKGSEKIQLDAEDKIKLFLRQIVASQLNKSLQDIATDQGFFEMGLESSSVIRIIRDIGRKTESSLGATILFEHPSIDQLSSYLLTLNSRVIERWVVVRKIHNDKKLLQDLRAFLDSESKPGMYAGNHSFNGKPASPLPWSGESLSEGQKGLWILQKMVPDMSAYNLPVCLRLFQSLNIELFQKACRLVVEQYPVLSTVIKEEKGVPYQVRNAQVLPDFRQENISGLHSTAIIPFIQEKAKEPFDLEQGPLLRYQLFQRSEKESYLLITLHHIIFDGRSLAPFLTTLLNTYEDLVAGRTPEHSPTHMDFTDFVTWEKNMMQGEEGRKRLSYWMEQLSGSLPVVHLPSDRPRIASSRFEGKTIVRTIPEHLSASIRQFARSQNVYLSTLFLGAFKVLLHKYTGEKDIIVGMASDQRPDERFTDQVGFFVNMLPLRSQVDESKSFGEYLKSLQKLLLNALANAYPFPALVQKLNIPHTEEYTPVFQTGYAYQNLVQAKDIPRLNGKDALPLEIVEEMCQEGEYEVSLEVFDQGKDFALHLKYHPGLFNATTIERLLDHLVILMEAALENPARLPGEYSLISSGEQKLLSEWNSRKAAYPAKCMHHIFEERVQQHPQKTAVVFDQDTLTYEQLHRRSHALALYLQSLGVVPDMLVGICVERSFEMVSGILGILQAGGAYVPLDPEYPSDRLAYMIQDSQARIILTLSKFKEKVSSMVAEGTMVIAFDGEWEAIHSKVQQLESEGVRLERKAEPHHMICVFYTSGSTGRPKGVMIEHRTLLNTLFFYDARFGLKEGDSYLLKSNYAFDFSLIELFNWFIGKGHLVILPPRTEAMPEVLAEYIYKHKVTHVDFIPTMFAVFLNEVKNRREFTEHCPLKYIMIGAEAFPKELVKESVSVFRNAEVVNLYGPTEASIFITWFSCSGNAITGNATPIGETITNSRVHIVDSSLRLVPVGVPGEICIEGRGVARGYLNQEALTAEKFIDNPFNPGTRLYRTGDLGRWLPDGNIEFSGRADHQVKLRGFRIELGEIEDRLSSHPMIDGSLAVVQKDGNLEQLVAYIVPSREGRKETAIHGEQAVRDIFRLREYLRNSLPEYMIPAAFVPLHEIPLTPSGKADRKALISRKIVFAKSENIALPQSETERLVLNIWREVLQSEAIGTEDRFFEAGGNSILAVTLTERIRKELKCPVNASVLFQYPTVKSLSSFICESAVTNSISCDTIKQENVSGNNGKSQLQNPETGSSVSFPSYYEDSVAIIGMSCHFPGAADPYAFWNNLREGREGIRFTTEEELVEMQVPETLIKDPRLVRMQSGMDEKHLFDPEFFGISPRDAGFMDPQFRQLLMHSWKAIEDAGYLPSDIPETSVYMSASNTFYQSLLPEGSLPTETIMKDAEKYVTWMFGQGGTIPTTISYKLGLKGESVFVHSNCSSSLTGLSMAYKSLKFREARQALVGASTIFPATLKGYVHQAGMNFSGDGHCKAFDASADGMIGSEGVAVLLLKRAADAIKDGDHIYALLRGIRVNNDGSDKAGFYAPGTNGQAEVIRQVLESTQIDPATITYVEAHGTGTKLGDPVEFAALSDTYRKFTDKKQFCGIGSVKTNIGHLDTASGLAGCIKVALSLKHQEIPPSLNYKNPNPEINFKDSPFYVADTLKKWESDGAPRRAALSSFGIGGTNVHAILEEYIPVFPDAAHRSERGNVSHIIPLSARNMERLKEYAQKLLSFIENPLDCPSSLAAVAYTLQVGRTPMAARVAFISGDLVTLAEQLKAFIQGKDKTDGVFRSEDQNGALPEEAEDLKVLTDLWIAKGQTDKLARAWVKGLRIDWKGLYTGEKPGRTSLPVYPFAREQHGITIAPASVAAKTGTAVPSSVIPLNQNGEHKQESEERSMRFLKKTWTPSAAAAEKNSEKVIAILTSADNEALAAHIARCFTRTQIIRLEELPSFLTQPEESWKAYDGCIDLLSSESDDNNNSARILWLQQLISMGHREGVMLLGVTKGLESFQNKSPELSGAAYAGLYRMLQSEYTHIRSRHLDMDPVTEDVLVARQIADEFNRESEEAEVCYRNGIRYTSILEETVTDAGSSVRFPQDHVLLITGGTRGLGYLCATHFVKHYGVRRLVLTGREQFPSRDLWDSWSLNHDSIGQKIRAVRDLEAQGVQVKVLSIDLADQENVQKHLSEIRHSMGPLGGIIHSAGLADWENPAFIHKPLQNMQEVWEPKVKGLINLFESVRTEPLQFFVLFSSVSSIIPALARGQSDYAMANAFMDYFAEHHCKVCPVVSIQWPSWKETGKGEAKTAAYQQTGLLSHTNQEGLLMLEHAISGKTGAVVMPAMVNPRLWKPEQLLVRTGRKQAVSATILPVSGEIVTCNTSIEKATQEWLTGLFARELKMDPSGFRPEIPFQEYGVDSILIAQLVTKMDGAVKGLNLNPSVILEHPSIGALTRYLADTCPEQLRSFLGTTESIPAAQQKTDTLLHEIQNWVVSLFARELKMDPSGFRPQIPFQEYGVDSILIAQLVTKMDGAVKGLNLNPSVILEYPSIESLAGYLHQTYPLQLGDFFGKKTIAGVVTTPAAKEPLKGSAATPALHEAKKTATDSMKEKIAVVGISCHFPGASGIGQFWANLKAGVDCIRQVPASRWDAKKYHHPGEYKKGKIINTSGGFLEKIEEFDPAYFKIPASLAPHIDPLQRQWLEVSAEALADAGYTREALWGRNVGVYIGTKAGNFYQKIGDREKDSVIGTGQNFIAAHLAHIYNFKGPNMIIDTACSSALTAVHLAMQSIRLGESEVALAGGVDILLDEECFLAMSAAQVLAPDGKCKPFSEDADGIGIGEGCGVIILKKLSAAIADGDKIYGVIEGSAINNDGNTMGITTPNPQAQQELIETAVSSAGIRSQTITYVEAHGTGTLIGDPIELKGLTRIFEKATDKKQFCGVGSVKSNIGHLLNASGSSGLIKVLLSIIHRQLPPTLHCDRPNPRFNFGQSPLYPVLKLQPWEGTDGVHRAGISAFGLGGHNGHLIVSDEGIPPHLLADMTPRLPLPQFNRKYYWPEPLRKNTPEASVIREQVKYPSDIIVDDEAMSFLSPTQQKKENNSFKTEVFYVGQ